MARIWLSITVDQCIPLPDRDAHADTAVTRTRTPP
jgi:hypothetical protein